MNKICIQSIKQNLKFKNFSIKTLNKFTNKNNINTFKKFDYSKITKVPDMGDSITEGTLVSWLKNENEFMAEDDVVCQIETDKVTVDVRATESGKIIKHFAAEDDTVEVGQDLFEFDENAEGESKPKEEKTEVKKEQVKEVKKEEKKSTPTPPKPSPPKPSKSTDGEPRERRVKMTRMRQRISQRLKDSQNTYAMLTTFNEIDMKNLMDMRSKFKDQFQEKHGVKLGFMSAFVKAAAHALVDQPSVNAVIDGNEIVYRDYVDISVAVASPNGLVVPVIRDCQDLKFANIEQEIVNLGSKAKNNQLTLQEMEGGTFTISNGGVFGSLMGTPIINPPQSAILGMHGINKRPVVVNDEIVIRPMMYIALTYDHRLVDGREGVLFLRKIKELIENPEKMLLE